MRSIDIPAVVSANQSIITGQRAKIILAELQPGEVFLHEAIFFVKPEISATPGVQLSKILDLIGRKFQDFSVELCGLSVLGSSYLRKYNLIGQHYGVINSISQRGIAALTPAVLGDIKKFYAKEFEGGATMLGGHQFLEAYPFFSPRSLAVLWDALGSTSRKFAPGTYGVAINVEAKPHIVLNGFHPHQLNHFNDDCRSIIVMVVRSDVHWATLREALVGDTDPLKAKPESLRRMLLERQVEFRIPVINKGSNGIHLSAGPLEGMVEVIRFCSDHSSARLLGPWDTCFGRMLIAAGLDVAEIEELSENPEVLVKGKALRAFDATENMDAAVAVKAIRRLSRRAGWQAVWSSIFSRASKP
jgi:hypothetical protein